MKKILLLIILMFSVSLILAQGKPCCKNKANKAKVSCKLNTTDIDVKKGDILLEGEIKNIDNTIKNCSNSSNSALLDASNCSGCKKTSWWKFWAKKKDCCNNNA